MWMKLTKLWIILLICTAAHVTSSSQLTLSHIPGTRLVKDISQPGHDILHADVTNHQDYYLLGQYVINDDVINDDVINNITLPIARKKGNEVYLMEPLSFTMIGQDDGCLQYWKMKCPQGYEAMSVVATLCGKPSISHYACVFDQFTRPYQLEYYKIAGKYDEKSVEMWKFVSYQHKPSFYFLYNTSQPHDDDVIKSDHQAIDPEPKFALSLRHDGDEDDEDEINLIRGRSFKPRYAIVSVDVTDDVYKNMGNHPKQRNDVTTTALIVVSSFFAVVGVATLWVKQRRKGGADASSLTSSDKTSVLQQMPTSSTTRHHNINISYTGGPDDDDDITPMTSRSRINSEQQAAVVNPYVDGNVEGLPSFNDVTTTYRHNT